MKTDENGNFLWDKRWSGEYRWNWGSSVKLCSDEGYLLCGNIAPSFICPFVVKTDSLGNEIWSRTYEDGWWQEGANRVENMAIKSDGGFFTIGYASNDTIGIGAAYISIMSCDRDGNLLWARRYGSDSGFNEGHSIEATSDGGCIAVGRADVGVIGDVYVVKIGPDGVIEWQSPKPDNISLSAYPNPFNSSVKITVGQTFLSVQNGQTGMSDLPVTIEIYDLRGHIVGANGVRPMDEGRMPYAPTNGTFIWQPDQTVPSGIYLIRARLGTTTYTKHIVYLK